MSTPRTSIRCPVAGMPIRAPVWVPRIGRSRGDSLAIDEDLIQAYLQVGKGLAEDAHALLEGGRAVHLLRMLDVVGIQQLVDHVEVAAVNHFFISRRRIASGWLAMVDLPCEQPPRDIR